MTLPQIALKSNSTKDPPCFSMTKATLLVGNSDSFHGALFTRFFYSINPKRHASNPLHKQTN